MKRVPKRMRIAIVISIFWLLGCFLLGWLANAVFDSIVAAFLLLIAWNVWWVIKEFKSRKADKAEDNKANLRSFVKELSDLETEADKIKSELSEIEKTK